MMLKKIQGYKKDANGQEYYLVKWKGFPSSENSWVKETEIDAPNKIRKYLRTSKKIASLVTIRDQIKLPVIRQSKKN